MHNEGLRRSTKGATMTSFKATCPELMRKVIIDIKKVEWEYDSSECELCGGHGYVIARYKCRCGKHHDLLVKDW